MVPSGSIKLTSCMLPFRQALHLSQIRIRQKEDSLGKLHRTSLLSSSNRLPLITIALCNYLRAHEVVYLTVFNHYRPSAERIPATRKPEKRDFLLEMNANLPC